MTIDHSYFQNHKLLIVSAAVLLLTPLVPEYIALPMTLFLFLWFKQQSKKNNEKVLLGDTGKVIFCFMVYQLITLLWANNKLYTLAISMMWMGTFLAYLMLANGVKSEEILDRFLFLAALSDGIMGLIASIQSILYGWLPKTNLIIFGENIALNELPNPFWRILDRLVLGFLPIQILPYEDPSRAASTYNNPLVYASVAVMLLPLALYCAYSMKGKYRLTSILCIFLSVSGVILSKSRAACLALIVVMFFSFLFGLKKWIGLLLCCSPFIAVFANRYLRDFLISFIGDDSTNTRIKIWQSSFAMIKENWVLGLGTGVQNIWDVLYNQYGINQPHAHNIFLEFTLESGIIGLLLFITFLGFFIYDMIRLFRISPKGRLLASSFIVGVTAFCFCGMFDFVFMSPKQLLSFMMLFGLAQASLRILTVKKEPTLVIDVTIEKKDVVMQITNHA